MQKSHIVFIVMDSCRHDLFVAASTPGIGTKCFGTACVEGKFYRAVQAA